MAITQDKTTECKKTLMAVHDAMYMLGGKWKISIVAALCFHPKRYSDILRDVNGISGKMLSRELKEMEVNKLVKRTVLDTQPVTVQYALTAYGQKLKPMIDTLALWGLEHRQMIVED
ncbi:winged helix-turn-helix transcriptional regulator [Fluviicola sp.]|uniref:winged helix-turn-helix transcriptional regulator n=1 Tax=Fluviicola sp. TaxID=1917219 RepID=UPI003D2DB48A